MSTQDISQWGSDVQQRRVELLNSLLWLGVVGGGALLAYLFFIGSGFLGGLERSARLAFMAPFFVAWALALVALVWRSLYYRTRALMFLIAGYTMSAFILTRSGMAGSGRLWLVLLPTVTFILLGRRLGTAFTGLSLVIYAINTLFVAWGKVPLHVSDSTTLGYWVGEGGDFLIVVLALLLSTRTLSRWWGQALADAREVKEDLQDRTADLEKTTRELHHRAKQLASSLSVTQASSSILDPDRLLDEVVHRVQSGFSSMGVYYVGCFLLDETRDVVTLEAATGRAGRELQEMDYQLRLDETTSVSRAVIQREAQVTPRIDETARFVPPFLEHTHSEIALPLRSRGQVLGALSVQSTREAAFSEGDVETLQTMADQVAIAIDNAQLFSRTESALEEVEAIHQRYLAQEWQGFLESREVGQVDYARPNVDVEIGDELRQARRRVVQRGDVVVVGDSCSRSEETLGPTDEPQYSAMVVPLKLRGQVIGTMALRDTHLQRPWTAEEIDMAETVAEQVAQTIENLRLMDESQRRAARERLVSDIAARLRESLDMESVLKSAAEEVREAMGLPAVTVRLRPQGDGEAANGDGGGG
jgi:GAF domain-containing protein